MERSLKQFVDRQRSEHDTETAIFNVGDEHSPAYALFLYADHQLYKVISVGPSLNEATEIADRLASRLASDGPERFMEWVKRSFPDEFCDLDYSQASSLLA